MLFEGVTYPLASMLPTTQGGRATLYQELRAAGYYSAGALTDYLALRNVLVVLPLLVAAVLALIFDPEDTPFFIVPGVILAILAFSLPRLYIQAHGRTRARQIERGLPTAVDLLVLALTAGLNLFAALQRVAGELRHTYPALAEEFDITRRKPSSAASSSRSNSLPTASACRKCATWPWCWRRSERMGSDATPALLEISNSLRTTMRQRAETQANRVSFWLLFPTIACFLVAAAIVLVGPVFLEFRRQIAENQNLLQEGTKNVSRFSRAPLRPQPGTPGGPQVPAGP